jgi:hypothetical protein
VRSCPECRSQLFERTHRGWSCSACGHREFLEDAEVLQPPPKRGSVHGNVWGEKRNPNRDRDAYLTSRRPANGSLKVALVLARENPRAAVAYLQDHAFPDGQTLNRDFLLASLYTELGYPNQARRCLEPCLQNLHRAKDAAPILQLRERIETLRKDILSEPLRTRKPR